MPQGTLELNRILRRLLNTRPEAQRLMPPKKVVTDEDAADDENVTEAPHFVVGDRVLQICNEYSKVCVNMKSRQLVYPPQNTSADAASDDIEKHQVFNGENGVVVDIAVANDNRSLIVVEFSDPVRHLVYTPGEQINSLLHAYAITVHKSQGSEFSVVVLFLTRANWAMLHRQLLYTAFTRAKRCVIIVGQQSALEHAVENTQMALTTLDSTRHSALKQRIRESFNKYTISA